MDLWILRHAEAEEQSSSGRDADRRLTPAGRRRMVRVAAALGRLGADIDLVLTSPLRRAIETAEPIVNALGIADRLSESESLLPDAAPAETLAELGRRDAVSALLVGHMPHLGFLLGLLLTGKTGFRAEIKKAALAHIVLPEGARPPGALRLYLPAGTLEKLVRA
jgi:phosphohistidine phosphatase